MDLFGKPMQNKSIVCLLTIITLKKSRFLRAPIVLLQGDSNFRKKRQKQSKTVKLRRKVTLLDTAAFQSIQVYAVNKCKQRRHRIIRKQILCFP